MQSCVEVFIVCHKWAVQKGRLFHASLSGGLFHRAPHLSLVFSAWIYVNCSLKYKEHFIYSSTHLPTHPLTPSIYPLFYGSSHSSFPWTECSSDLPPPSWEIQFLASANKLLHNQALAYLSCNCTFLTPLGHSGFVVFFQDLFCSLFLLLGTFFTETLHLGLWSKVTFSKRFSF